MATKPTSTSHRELGRHIRKLEADNDRLTDAILWALGEKGDFPLITREQLEAKPCPKYHWRAELRRRAFGDPR